jgi:hypothetical protein
VAVTEPWKVYEASWFSAPPCRMSGHSKVGKLRVATCNTNILNFRKGEKRVSKKEELQQRKRWRLPTRDEDEIPMQSRECRG